MQAKAISLITATSLCVPLGSYLILVRDSSSDGTLQGELCQTVWGTAVAAVRLLKPRLSLQYALKGSEKELKLKVLEFIEVEGSEIECAIFTAILIEAMKMKNDADKKKEVEEWLNKYGDMTFEELMKRERDEGE